MKKLIALLCVLSNFAFGQKIVTTYYDWQKTKKKEVYQTDANGTRHGSYKNFDEQGAIRNEGVFKYGKKNGVFVEYTKFPNYAGAMQVKTKETYITYGGQLRIYTKDLVTIKPK
jgi:antitoxin component YwqK of YwqJK toxin-antitoxin module